MSRNFRTKDCQWYVVKRIKSFCGWREKWKKFAAPRITSSSFHFFSKTDLEQYLFKKITVKAS